jgi:pimeloyl-ACP methyl ester carboxylesterase
MGPLRRYLRRLGHDARHWGLGTNHGDPEGDSERLVEIVRELARQTARPVRLVGWSLGGVIARETARVVPQHVEHVVTLGTPVIGGPTYTLAARAWGRRECERIARLGLELDEQSPITVPMSAIFTRRDEVVSWPACIDRVSPNVVHFEVFSTHVGLIVDPAVWQVAARRLAPMAGRRARPRVGAAGTLRDRPEDRAS